MANDSKNGVDPINEKLDLALATLAQLAADIEETKSLVEELFEKVDEAIDSGFGDLDLN